MSTRIPESLRAQIDATDRGSCCYCLTSEAVSGIPLTYDHITPTSRGGLTTFDNVCLACRTCNEFKTNIVRAVDPLTQEVTPCSILDSCAGRITSSGVSTGRKSKVRP